MRRGVVGISMANLFSNDPDERNSQYCSYQDNLQLLISIPYGYILQFTKYALHFNVRSKDTKDKYLDITETQRTSI